MWLSQIAYQTERLMWEKFFDVMISSESDEMTALWTNESLTLTFYVTLSNSTPNWKRFKDFSDLMLSSKNYEMTVVWPNDS